MSAETPVETAPPVGAEIKIERMDDSQYRAAVYAIYPDGKFYIGALGSGTFDEAKAAAEEFGAMVLSLPKCLPDPPR